MITDPSVVADFWSITIAPRASPRPCETKTLYSRVNKVQKKFTGDCFRPVVQYVMMTKIVGRTSSIGRSPTILDTKYEESRYMPEDRSFSSIVLSVGNVKIAWKRG